jgi:hypothetical protein
MHAKVGYALACRKYKVENDGESDQNFAIGGPEAEARLGFEEHSQEKAGHINHR